MTNSEMAEMLKTPEGRRELRQSLIGIMSEGGTLTNTEFIILVTLNNMEEDGN